MVVSILQNVSTVVGVGIQLMDMKFTMLDVVRSIYSVVPLTGPWGEATRLLAVV
jgi:hypothetical protein